MKKTQYYYRVVFVKQDEKLPSCGYMFNGDEGGLKAAEDWIQRNCVRPGATYADAPDRFQSDYYRGKSTAEDPYYVVIQEIRTENEFGMEIP